MGNTSTGTAQQGTNELGGTEAVAIRQQLQRGDLSLLRQLLAKTRQERDWQDRYFMLDLLAPSLPAEAVQTACSAEPDAADLALIRGAHLFDLVAKSRGTAMAEKTAREQFEKAAAYIKEAMPTLKRALALAPEDPVPYVFAIRMLQMFGETAPSVLNAYQAAIRLAPDFVPAHFATVQARSHKWGGSHDESLRIARAAFANAKPGSDLAVCLFIARILEWQFFVLFEKDPKRAKACLEDRTVNKDLSAAFDRWTQAPYQPRRSSVPYLQHAAYWFYKTGDRERLARVFQLSGGAFFERAWSFASKARDAYGAAVAMADKKQSGLLGWFKS